MHVATAKVHPLHTLLNITVVDVGNGTAVIHSQPDAKFENAMGRMHGGYIASIIDAAMGSAAASKVPDGQLLGTIDLNVKYVGKIDLTTGKLIATANVIHAGRTLLTVEAKVADEAGRIYAHGSGTFMVYPKQ
jgi:uncharacterized protein (TIGR00369 family)